jgi:hypothetical protein
LNYVYIINQHNALFISLYFITMPLHVLGPFVAHNQEAECIMYSARKSPSLHTVCTGTSLPCTFCESLLGAYFVSTGCLLHPVPGHSCNLKYSVCTRLETSSRRKPRCLVYQGLCLHFMCLVNLPWHKIKYSGTSVHEFNPFVGAVCNPKYS